MVNIEMHMFKHEPFLFVGGGGGKAYLYFMVRICNDSFFSASSCFLVASSSVWNLSNSTLSLSLVAVF